MRFIKSQLLLFWAVLFCMQAHAAQVKLIKTFDIATIQAPANSEAVISFDDNNQLKLSFETSYYLSSLCHSALTINGSPSHMVFLRMPRVDWQRCLPNAAFPQGREYAVGVDANGKILWWYLLTVPISPNQQDFQQVIGASKQGLVIYSYATQTLGVISATTGKVIYPLPAQQPVKFDNPAYALYDAAEDSIYIAKTNDETSELDKISLQTGTVMKLAALPVQFFTKVPARVYAMDLTADQHYLAILAHVGSRLSTYDYFMVYDVTTNQWIYKKTISTPYSNAGMLIVKGNNIGTLFNNGSGKYIVNHYVIN